MRKQKTKTGDEIQPEYDMRALLKSSVRNKYAKQYKAGTNVVLLDPEVHKTFRDSKAVNDALRLVIQLRKVGGGKSLVS